MNKHLILLKRKMELKDIELIQSIFKYYKLNKE